MGWPHLCHCPITVLILRPDECRRGWQAPDPHRESPPGQLAPRSPGSKVTLPCGCPGYSWNLHSSGDRTRSGSPRAGSDWVMPGSALRPTLPSTPLLRPAPAARAAASGAAEWFCLPASPQPAPAHSTESLPPCSCQPFSSHSGEHPRRQAGCLRPLTGRHPFSPLFLICKVGPRRVTRKHLSKLPLWGLGLPHSCTSVWNDFIPILPQLLKHSLCS